LGIFTAKAQHHGTLKKPFNMGTRNDNIPATWKAEILEICIIGAKNGTGTKLLIS
jgi:hypothetical protein